MAKDKPPEDNVTKLPVAKRMGRPRYNWTPEVEEVILSGIIAGKSVRKIVKEEDKSFPCVDTIYRYMAGNVEFSDRYTRARDIQQDIYAEEIIAIADGDHPDFENKSVDERKMAIESRKWTMGKLRPKKYNDRLVAEITGANGAPLIPAQTIDVASLTDDARASLKFALMAVTNRAEAETIEADDEQ